MPFFVINVVLPVPLRRFFDYLPREQDKADDFQPGTRVRVSFGNQTLHGIVLGTHSESDVPTNKLKPILDRLDDTPLLSDSDIELCQWLAKYYHHSIGEVLEHFLPTLLRQGASLDEANERVWKKLNKTPFKKLGTKQEALWQLFNQAPLWAHSQLTKQGFSGAQIQSLEKLGLVEEHYRLPIPSTPAERQAPLSLNSEQQQALIVLQQQLGRFQACLLEGVTGSGKTEVYLQLIESALQNNKQVLVLVPEIGLTPQTVKRFQTRFEVPIALLHSGLNDRERLQGWRLAKEGHARILIGTRSAVFTPLPDLGLIIIDEEHDGSFKQQDGLRYSARDFALVRASKAKVPVVLGSATPSLETLRNALDGKYIHLKLSQRAGNAKPPRLILQDILNQPLIAGFAESVIAAMHEHIQNNKQVLVFINRRGFAPLIACQDCGWQAECQHCDARLTVHQYPPRLHCHHCDWQQPIPNTCPQCHGHQLVDQGLGTEKIQEYLTTIFADIPIHRIDRDTVSGKKAFDQMYDKINIGGAGILVGTQMLAKGHHFPDVTMVVVLGTDSGLFSSDFRGLEHSAQLIYQVAGRAGREESPGEVWIQTMYAHHPALNLLLEQGYHGLGLNLLQERQSLQLPPFSYMALLRSESVDQHLAVQLLQQANGFVQHWLRHHFPHEPSAPIRVLGPFPSIMERKAGKFRYQMQFFTERRPVLHALMDSLINYLDKSTTRKVRWHIDIDPIDTI